MRRFPVASPSFGVRLGTEADAPQMGAVAYRVVNLPQDRATAECLTILKAPFSMSAVATLQDSGSNERVVGVLNGVLLLPGFARRLPRFEEPYFHRHLEEESEPPFPGERLLGLANATQGLDLFLAHFAVSEGLSEEDAATVRQLLVFFFVENFSGNRLRSVMVETVGRGNTAMAISGGFRVLSSFPAWRQEFGVLRPGAPHLLQITLERALSRNNYHLARLLSHRAPIFRFPPVAREVLLWASRGMDDPEIHLARGISNRAIKGAWGRIYDIVEKVKPGMLVSLSPRPRSIRRSALLAYIRNHPEELWPYEEPAAPRSPSRREAP